MCVLVEVFGTHPIYDLQSLFSLQSPRRRRSHHHIIYYTIFVHTLYIYTYSRSADKNGVSTLYYIHYIVLCARDARG